MGSSNRVPLLVVMAGVFFSSICMAGYIWFLAPKKAAKVARAEVLELAERWTHVRRCLYGDSPLSNDPGEAILLRELTVTDATETLSRCEPHLESAWRGAGSRSDSEVVESAWETFRKGRSELARALAHRGADPRVKRIEEIRRYLVAATRKAEVGYQGLRAAAGLDADPIAGQPLAREELIPLDPSVTADGVELVSAENNVVVAVDVASEPRRMLLRSNEKSQLTTLRPGVAVAASPPPAWGVQITDPNADQADQAGRAQRGSSASDLAVVSLEEPGAPAMSIGKLRTDERFLGAVGNAEGQRLLVVLESNTDEPNKARARTYFSPTRGSPFSKGIVELKSDDGDYPRSHLDFAFGRLMIEASFESIEWSHSRLDHQPSRRPATGDNCFGSDSSWQRGESSLMFALGGELETVRNSEEMPWRRKACTDSQLLGASARGEVISAKVCNRRDCPARVKLPLPENASWRVLLSPKRGPMIFTSLRDVVLVWSSGKEGQGLEPSSAFNIGEAELIDVVEWAGKLFAVVSVPPAEKNGEPWIGLIPAASSAS